MQEKALLLILMLVLVLVLALALALVLALALIPALALGRAGRVQKTRSGRTRVLKAPMNSCMRTMTTGSPRRSSSRLWQRCRSSTTPTTCGRWTSALRRREQLRRRFLQPLTTLADGDCYFYAATLALQLAHPETAAFQVAATAARRHHAAWLCSVVRRLQAALCDSAELRAAAVCTAPPGAVLTAAAAAAAVVAEPEGAVARAVREVLLDRGAYHPDVDDLAAWMPHYAPYRFIPVFLLDHEDGPRSEVGRLGGWILSAAVAEGLGY